MPTKLSPLLCELHAHTTWSDGALSPRELCDLYGRVGLRCPRRHRSHDAPGGNVDGANFAEYLADLAAEAARAARFTTCS